MPVKNYPDFNLEWAAGVQKFFSCGMKRIHRGYPIFLMATTVRPVTTVIKATIKKINGVVQRTTPFWRRKEAAKRFQTGLLPAGSRILAPVAHHRTHCGKSAAGVGIDLSDFDHVIDAYLIQLSLQFGYIVLQCVSLGGVRIVFGKFTLKGELL
jgi:hypothetical protein